MEMKGSKGSGGECGRGIIVEIQRSKAKQEGVHEKE